MAKKKAPAPKQPTRSGKDPRAGAGGGQMGDDVRTDREIVDDILKEVRKAGAKVPATRVNELIERLRVLKLRGSLLGNRTLNREHAEKIISWIYEGGQLFALFSICSTRADH